MKTETQKASFTFNGRVIKTRPFGGEWRTMPSGFELDNRDMATGRLMATAPELLTACKNALEAIRQEDDVLLDSARMDLIEAISKAEAKA